MGALRWRNSGELKGAGSVVGSEIIVELRPVSLAVVGPFSCRRRGLRWKRFMIFWMMLAISSLLVLGGLNNYLARSPGSDIKHSEVQVAAPSHTLSLGSLFIVFLAVSIRLLPRGLLNNSEKHS